jgi:preprotein translocase subunit Sec63
MKKILLLLLFVFAIINTCEGAKGKVPQKAKEVAKEDFYKVLGVKKNVDEKGLKKAYRKKSLEHHPDKNPDNREEAEKKFIEASAHSLFY